MFQFKPFKGLRFLYNLLIITILVFSSFDVLCNTGEGSIQFNPEYKLKSYSGVVTVYTFTEGGDKVEYIFNEFHADVLLLVYRRLDLVQIIERMSKKYGLSEKDCRRNVKMTINTLELWDIVIRN